MMNFHAINYFLLGKGQNQEQQQNTFRLNIDRPLYEHENLRQNYQYEKTRIKGKVAQDEWFSFGWTCTIVTLIFHSLQFRTE